MKLKSMLLAATLVMFSAATATAIATEVEKHEAVTSEQDEAKKPVKKHSHMEEKTNVPMNEPAPHMDKEMPKDRHDHMKEKH